MLKSTVLSVIPGMIEAFTNTSVRFCFFHAKDKVDLGKVWRVKKMMERVVEGGDGMLNLRFGVGASAGTCLRGLLNTTLRSDLALIGG